MRIPGLTTSLLQLSLLGMLLGVDPVKVDATLIDDRSSRTLKSSHAGEWRLITDQVMGGRSSGELVPDFYLGKHCLRLRGQVSTANNGGFLQLALDLSDGRPYDASSYAGVELEVAGNGELYNVHLRTSNLWLPWQAYRAGFQALPEWQSVRIPFAAFKAYRTTSELRTDKLVRIGLVAIGRDFGADLCVAALSFYRDDDASDK